MFWKVSQKLQENTCVGVSFLTKLQGSACNLKKSLGDSASLWILQKNFYSTSSLASLKLPILKWPLHLSGVPVVNFTICVLAIKLIIFVTWNTCLTAGGYYDNDKITLKGKSTLKLNSSAHEKYEYGHLGRWYIKLTLFKRF